MSIERRTSMVGGLRRTGIRGGGGASLWTPSQLSLHVWYCDEWVDDGTNIITWTDKSGNGDDITQGTASLRATIVSRYGTSVPQFDGADFYQGAFSSSASQPFSVVATFEATDTTVNTVCDSDDATNRMLIDLASTTTNCRGYAGASVTDGATTVNTVHAVLFEANGASSSIAVDAWGSPTTGNAGAQEPDGITIGTNYTGGAAAGFAGYIPEIIVVNGLMTASEKASLPGYLNSAWSGLAVTT